MKLFERLGKKELTKLYVKEYLTMEEIGKLYGVSRQAICLLSKKYNVKAQDGERPLCSCCKCGKKYRAYRRDLKRNKSNYCSMVCYASARFESGNKDIDYKKKRHYLRIAREQYEHYHGIKLKSNEVIHHIDGDCMNNSKENLMRFSSQSEHLKHHHKIRINSHKNR